jgi:hypothetical protein
MSSLHKEQTIALGVHTPFAWEWTNAAGRAAQTGVTSADINALKVGLQKDDNTIWRALTIAPTWELVGGSGVAGNEHLEEDSATNTVTDAVTLQHNTDGSVADGFGTGIALQAESSTTEDRDVAQVAAVWEEATDGSRTGALVFYAYDGATKKQVMRLHVGDQTVADPTISSMGPGAIDLQTGRAAASLLPYGDFSAILGGRDNEVNATADLAVVLGGMDGEAVHRGEVTHSTGSISTRGDAKWSVVHFFVNINSHTSTTWYDLFLDGATEYFTVPSQTAITLLALVTGINSADSTARWSYMLTGSVSKAAGSANYVSSTPTAIEEHDANYDVRFADNEVAGGDGLAVQVQRVGGTDYDINWTAMVIMSVVKD